WRTRPRHHAAPDSRETSERSRLRRSCFESDVGFPARRLALRTNRRLSRAERNGFQVGLKMTAAATVCAKCGATISAYAPEGLCTACLFEAGLGLLAHPSVTAGDDYGSVENIETSDTNTAVHIKK